MKINKQSMFNHGDLNARPHTDNHLPHNDEDKNKNPNKPLPHPQPELEPEPRPESEPQPKHEPEPELGQEPDGSLIKVVYHFGVTVTPGKRNNTER